MNKFKLFSTTQSILSHGRGWEIGGRNLVRRLSENMKNFFMFWFFESSEEWKVYCGEKFSFPSVLNLSKKPENTKEKVMLCNLSIASFALPSYALLVYRKLTWSLKTASCFWLRLLFLLSNPSLGSLRLKCLSFIEWNNWEDEMKFRFILSREAFLVLPQVNGWGEGWELLRKR